MVTTLTESIVVRSESYLSTLAVCGLTLTLVSAYSANANKSNEISERNTTPQKQQYMANYSIKADLLKLKGAFVTNLKGKTATKRCLCIPIDDSGLFLGEKGCYLNMVALAMREPKFGDSHCVKVSLDKAVMDAMTEEERNAVPILGGLHELIAQTSQAAPAFIVTEEEDLPF